MRKREPIRLALDMFVLGQGVKSGVYRVCDELYPRLCMEADFLPRYVLPPQYAEAALNYIEFRKLPGFLHDAPVDCPSKDADILLSPFNALSETWAGDKNVLHAHIIYDLIAIRRPEFFPANAAEEVKGIMDSLASDTLIFAISAHTKKDLLEYRPDLSSEQITVIPLAAAYHFRPIGDPEQKKAVRKRYGIPPQAPYILSLATLEIRKNLEQVIRAFIHLLSNHPENEIYLVLAGMKGWMTEKMEEMMQATGKCRDRIILPGFVEDNDLPALYSDAVCFVYMSRYEGFGLPPLEAMACGLPVICSDNSSLPEVVGDAGIMLGADDTAGIARAMERLLADKNLRAELSQKGLARAELFSWDRCARMVADTLREGYIHRRFLQAQRTFYCQKEAQSISGRWRQRICEKMKKWAASISALVQKIGSTQ